MITDGEIRRNAARLQVDPMVIDLDYSLSWFLLGLTQVGELGKYLVFKGGTCLRKCYFPDYRFSEDLDFTAVHFLAPQVMEGWIDQAARWIADHDGPDFQVQPAHFEIVTDDYGSESYQARVYYRGPLRWGGSPRTVRLDMTRAEKLLLPRVEKPILHPYSDQPDFSQNRLACYCLEEMLAEKIRAVGGQRRFAISRDLYDIYHLLSSGADLQVVKGILPEKFAVRGLTLSAENVRWLEGRRPEFERDWQRRLSYLVYHPELTFDTVWQSVLQFFAEIAET